MLNDLFNEIPENLVTGLILRFLNSGFVDLIDNALLFHNIPCDFDVLSFYVKFSSLIHLHAKELYTRERLEKNFARIFELLLNKQLVCNNVRRYLTSYANDTVKNLSSELVSCYNVDSSFGPFLTA